ncbi:MAG: hypothetical protein GY841_19425 [FCB group bacterium]|nr:hypothetical protein [FCB group bacterium]
MAKVLIVYASDYGSTKRMAAAVAQGAGSVEGVEAVVKAAEETMAEDMTSSDAIVFGSPAHMGSLDWRVKKLFDTVCSGLWMKSALNGKVGAVFTTGGGFGLSGGGAELTMLSMLANLVELGMIIVPLPKNTPGYELGGLHWGPNIRTMDNTAQPLPLTEESFESARNHGVHVGRLSLVLGKTAIFDH